MIVMKHACFKDSFLFSTLAARCKNGELFWIKELILLLKEEGRRSNDSSSMDSLRGAKSIEVFDLCFSPNLWRKSEGGGGGGGSGVSSATAGISTFVLPGFFFDFFFFFPSGCPITSCHSCDDGRARGV